MGSEKPAKTNTASRRPLSREELSQQMSEIISLREKVAQAELVAQLYGLNLGQNDVEPME